MAFDLTKPSATDATFAASFGFIRENVRAMVQGDAGVFSKFWCTASIAEMVLETTGVTAKGRNVVTAGGGGNIEYDLFMNADWNGTNYVRDNTGLPAWNVRMYSGADNFVIQRAGAAANPIAWTTLFTIDSSGAVGIKGATSGGYSLTVNGAPATLHTGIQIIGSTTAAAFINVANTSGNMQLGVDSSAGGNYGSAYGSFAGSATATNFALIANNIVRLLLHQNGNVVMGTAALATNATDGFFYGASCAGTPTGAPTAFTGRVPMIYDTTNNKLYVYNGAWKSVTLT
jgi:hypothetical protein